MNYRDFINKYSKYILITITSLIIIIFLITLLSKTQQYNIVYKKDNEIIFYNNKKTSIKSDSYNEIKYSNKGNNYILYTKDNNLYLNDNILIIKNTLTYTFSHDDKYVITLDKTHNLYTYNIKEKELIKIDNKVDNYLTYNNNYILYIRNKILYLKEINKEIIFEINKFNYDNSPIYKIIDNYLYYLDNNNNLIKKNINNKEEELITKNVSYFYIDKYKILIENINSSLSYYDKIITNISNYEEIFDYNLNNNQILYTNKNKLYYSNITNNIEVTNELITKAIIINKNTFYYTTDNKLYLCTIKDNKINKKLINENVFIDTIVINNNNLIYIIKNSEEHGNLYVYKNNKSILIDKEVLLEEPTIINNEIYYMKKNSNEKYDLKSYYNKTKIIVKNIKKYKCYNNKSIYYVNEENELYIKSLFKKKIDNNIIDIKEN